MSRAPHGLWEPLVSSLVPVHGGTSARQLEAMSKLKRFWPQPCPLMLSVLQVLYGGAGRHQAARGLQTCDVREQSRESPSLFVFSFCPLLLLA